MKEGIVVPSPPPPPAPVSSGMVFSTQNSTGGSCPPYVSNYGSSQACMVALQAGQRINFGTTVVQGSACQGLTSISLRDGRQTYVTSLFYNKGNCSYSSWTVQTEGNYQIQETCVFADQPCGGTVAFTFGTPSPPPPPPPLPPPAVFTSTRVRIGHDHFENMLMGIGHNNPHPRNGGATSTSTETTADGYKNTYVTSTTTEAAVVRTGTGHEKSKFVTSTTTDVQHPVTRTFYNSPPPPPSPAPPPSPPLPPPSPPSPPPPAFVASAALTNGACQSDNTGDKTYRTCWPSAGSAGGVTQSWTSGLPKKTTTVTLARNMAWTSSTATSAGGFYTLSYGDGSCGAGGAPRGGRMYLSCAPATSLKVLEPSTCYYNITYSMPTACAGSVPVGTFTTPSGLCLGAAAGSAAGTLVQLQPCAAGSGAQAWSLIPSSSPGFSALFNGATGLCLDVSGGYTTNGTKLQLYTCNGSPAQRWSNPAATPAAMTSGMGTRICAAAAGAAGAQAVTQNPCATATQQWRFTPSA